MEKRLEAMEEQFKKEKEESKLQFEKERKVGGSMTLTKTMSLLLQFSVQCDCVLL